MSADMTQLWPFASPVFTGAAIGTACYWLQRSFESLILIAASEQGPQRSGKAFGPSKVIAPLAGAISRNLKAGRENPVLSRLLSQIDRGLQRSGRRREITPVDYCARAITFSLFAGVGVAILGAVMGFLNPIAVLSLMLMGFIVSFAAQIGSLESQAGNRISTIEKKLPFAAEFLLMVMQAGSTFEAAIDEYCAQMENDPLSEELQFVRRDLEAGVQIDQALLRMSDRAESKELSNFLTAVTTGLASGQSMEQALKIQAKEARTRRYQNAEETAKVASTKATPLVVLVAIGAMILLVAPLLIRMSSLWTF